MVYYRHSRMEDKCMSVVHSEIFYYNIICKPLLFRDPGFSAAKNEEQLPAYEGLAAASYQDGLEG